LAIAAAGWGCNRVPVEEIPETADPSAEITQLRAEIDSARADSVDALSPEHFKEADKQYNDAVDDRNHGKDAKKILHHVAEGKAHIKKAREVAQVAKSTIPEVVEARAAALAADAPEYAKKAYTDAEKELEKATRKIEDGKLSTAESDRKDLKQRFNDAELAAIKESNLGAAWRNVDQARKENAAKWAPKSLAEADATVKQAGDYIAANPHNADGVKAQAKAATDAAAHLLKVTREARVTEKQDAESLVLQKEAQDKRLAAEQAATKAGEAALAGTEGNVEKLRAENAQLQGQADFNQKLNDAQGKFSATEANVLRQGNDLVIRLKGLQFKSGKSGLQGKDYALLNKVAAVANEFGDSRVRVYGNTDSVGNKKTNAKLSADRAQTVADYLAANGVNGSRLSSQGFGDSQPIAPNNTAAGRAENRRVDVVIEGQQPSTAH
jgi:outer membrane protein OmpA-like peptidoglycan-associated protein